MTNDAFADVADWYKAEFVSEGWEVISETSMEADGSLTAILTYQKGEMTASVTVIEDVESPGEVGIVHTIHQS